MKTQILKPGDEVLLIEATRLLNNETVTLARAAAILSEPTYFMVVALSERGTVMGRIYGNILHRHDSVDLLLYEVDVLAGHQRKGVGKAMIELARAFCKSRGYGEMWVLTELDNEAGNALYNSAGGKLEDSPTNMYVFPIAERKP